MSLPTVSEFFRGRSVFITGATGFMGKVLVEKLLRSCPDIGHIYVIIRSKKQSSPAQRLQKLLELQLFDRLKLEQPTATEKVTALSGEMTELGLGLSEQDRRTLTDHVSIIFNVAATVRFDDPLRDAVLMNVRGPREVLRVAADMKQLVALLHVSTSFSNLDHIRIEERVYAPHADWRRMILAAETMDPHLLSIITPKLLGTLPNTYTFSKSMGEHVMNDHREDLPIVIFRPAIVISTAYEPMPGWLDNFNGPMGMMVAAGKGVIRTALTHPDVVSDYMAVDIAIKAMVVAAWEKGCQPRAGNVPIYNATTGSVKRVTMTEIMEKSLVLSEEYPLDDIIWIPTGVMTNNYRIFYIRVILGHVLPALLIDAVLKFSGRKSMLFRLQRRIFVANLALQYFLRHGWDIANDNFMELDKAVLAEDRDAWSFDIRNLDVDEYLRCAFIGARKYLLNEKDSNMAKARLHYQRMKLLDRITRALYYIALVWFAYTNNVIGRAADMLQHAFTSLTS